jgi:hypothetical protein
VDVLANQLIDALVAENILKEMPDERTGFSGLFR